MAFSLMDFFDSSVIERIRSGIEADPNTQIWLEAYCDGKQYYPLTIENRVILQPAPVRPCLRGLCTVEDGWGREAGSGEMAFSLMDFFDSSVIERIRSGVDDSCTTASSTV